MVRDAISATHRQCVVPLQRWWGEHEDLDFDIPDVDWR